MENLSNYIITPKTPIIEAMSKIDSNARGIVFLCDDDGVVLGSLTDGDVRRHIISGGRLDTPSFDAAKKDFVHISTDEEDNVAYGICIERSLTAIPRVDGKKRIASIYFKGEAKTNLKPQLNTPVVIMAGGKGTRLYPYTKILPKPLVPVGDLTITEHIVSKFMEYGCNRIIMIINHKKNMIKAYFADEHPNHSIEFVDEETPLGTGGGLKLLEGLVNDTFFMSNCDMLVFADYEEILKAHKESGSIITMVCATKTVTIPYGVIEINGDGEITKLTEKPSFPFLTNTGLYVIEPTFINYIGRNTVSQITETIQACVNAKEKVSIFPISEDQWSDMGQLDEMEKMQRRLAT